MSPPCITQHVCCWCDEHSPLTHSSSLFDPSQELSLYKRFNHKNIVRFLGSHYDADEAALTIFLEYVPGGSLEGLVLTYGPLGEGVVRSYAKQILEGLAFLHANG